MALSLDLNAIGQIQPVGGYLRDLLSQYQETFNQYVQLYEESALPDQPILLSWNLQPLLQMENGEYLYEGLDYLQTQFNLLSTGQLGNQDSIAIPSRAFPSLDPNGYLSDASSEIESHFNGFLGNLP